MDCSAQDQLKSRVKRFRLRFSLRAMMVMITIVCILIPTWILPSERQRRAAEQIEASGGICAFSAEQLPAEIIDAESKALGRNRRILDRYRYRQNASSKPSLQHHWYDHYFYRVTKVELAPRPVPEINWAVLTELKKIIVNHDLSEFSHDISTAGGDKLLESISSIRTLQYLEFRRLLSNASMRHFEKLENLEFLAFSLPQKSDEGFVHLAKLKRLRELSINGSHFTEAGIAVFKNFTRLEKLHFNYVTLPSLKQFGQLMSLKEIDFEYLYLGDRSLEFLENLTKLESIRLENTLFNEDELRYVKNLGQLRRLSLKSCYRMNDQELRHLTGLQSLHELDVSNSGGISEKYVISDAGLGHIGQLLQLRRLNLSHTQTSDAGLRSLQNLQQLRELDLYNTRVTPKGYEHLDTLNSLETLRGDIPHDSPVIKRLDQQGIQFYQQRDDPRLKN